MDEPVSEHYFTAEPASDAAIRRVPVTLAGRDVTVATAGGIFSPDGIDKGTAVLLREAPEPSEPGNFLDLGCGWGPLALTLALRSPQAQVWGVDVNERALALARRNAASLGCGHAHFGVAGEVPDELAFDLIWSNPPIRIGKAALHELLLTWLPRLKPEGAAYLVVSKNLGADSLQRWLTGHGYAATRLASSKGFRVLRASHS